jgi:hypothetical protein
MDAAIPADMGPQEETVVDPHPAAPEPIPLPHALDDRGRPVPLPGVEPVFLTGTTVDLLDLQPPSAADGAPAPPLALVTVPKDKLLGDIQVGWPWTLGGEPALARQEPLLWWLAMAGQRR